MPEVGVAQGSWQLSIPQQQGRYWISIMHFKDEWDPPTIARVERMNGFWEFTVDGQQWLRDGEITNVRFWSEALVAPDHEVLNG